MPIELIEGQATLVVKREPPLEPSLDKLLSKLRTTYRADIRPAGARAACERREHRFTRFREGRHFGTDAVIRDLRLEMCLDCGAVCVRDISFDMLPNLVPGRGGPRRRNVVLGWYTGTRRAARTYT